MAVFKELDTILLLTLVKVADQTHGLNTLCIHVLAHRTSALEFWSYFIFIIIITLLDACEHDEEPIEAPNMLF